METPTKPLPKLDVRAAVYAVQNYFQSIQDLMGVQIEDLRLEEVELSEDKKNWLITLGYEQPSYRNNPLGLPTIPQPQPREYKVFKLNAETGEVESMKIREL
jgi:hypothetical protein